MTSGAFVYILRCADGSYCTGTTRTSLEGRLAEHNSGHFGGYTATRSPVVMVYSQWFERITDAIAAERKIKGWSRAKKEALIRNWRLCLACRSDGGLILRDALRASSG